MKKYIVRLKTIAVAVFIFFTGVGRCEEYTLSGDCVNTAVEHLFAHNHVIFKGLGLHVNPLGSLSLADGDITLKEVNISERFKNDWQRSNQIAVKASEKPSEEALESCIEVLTVAKELLETGEVGEECEPISVPKGKKEKAWQYARRRRKTILETVGKEQNIRLVNKLLEERGELRAALTDLGCDVPTRCTTENITPLLEDLEEARRIKDVSSKKTPEPNNIGERTMSAISAELGVAPEIVAWSVNQKKTITRAPGGHVAVHTRPAVTCIDYSGQTRDAAKAALTATLRKPGKIKKRHSSREPKEIEYTLDTAGWKLDGNNVTAKGITSIRVFLNDKGQVQGCYPD
jgi:hypothetical protein